MQRLAGLDLTRRIFPGKLLVFQELTGSVELLGVIQEIQPLLLACERLQLLNSLQLMVATLALQLQSENLVTEFCGIPEAKISLSLAACFPQSLDGAWNQVQVLKAQHLENKGL